MLETVLIVVPSGTEECLGRCRRQNHTCQTCSYGSTSVSQTHLTAVPEGITTLDEEAGRGTLEGRYARGRDGYGKDVSPLLPFMRDNAD